MAGHSVFYNGSSFDGNDSAATAADDGAVATDKVALPDGQTGGPDNVTTYLRGINGVMIDVAGLPAGQTPTADDFTFEVSAGGAWSAAPTTPAVTVRPGAGASGSDRVTLTWPDNALRNTWLRVTLKANARTGLAAPDVFSFGNLIGDANGDGRVNALDVAAVKRVLGTASAITGRADFNRDGRVNALDVAAVKQNLSRSLAPVAASPAPASSPAAVSPILSGTAVLSVGSPARRLLDEQGAVLPG